MSDELGTCTWLEGMPHVRSSVCVNWKPSSPAALLAKMIASYTEARLSEVRAATIEEVLIIVAEERDAYQRSATACDTSGNPTGGTFDTVSTQTCKRLFERIRSLSAPQSTQEEK